MLPAEAPFALRRKISAQRRIVPLRKVEFKCFERGVGRSPKRTAGDAFLDEGITDKFDSDPVALKHKRERWKFFISVAHEICRACKGFWKQGRRDPSVTNDRRRR